MVPAVLGCVTKLLRCSLQGMNNVWVSISTPQTETIVFLNRKQFTKIAVCVCDPVTSLVKEAGGDMERINEETGELSTSGESTENTELKNAQCHIEPGGEENSYTGLDATMALKKQLLELEKATVEQREEQLLHLLPTFIQVTTQHTDRLTRVGYKGHLMQVRH